MQHADNDDRVRPWDVVDDVGPVKNRPQSGAELRPRNTGKRECLQGEECCLKGGKELVRDCFRGFGGNKGPNLGEVSLRRFG